LIADDSIHLEGALTIPSHAQGLVLFAHGSGSSRHSSRNQQVARSLQNVGLATLLFDLLTKEEERIDAATAHLRFDIDFLASRLRVATRWARDADRTSSFRVGYFGASTGAAAALVAAAELTADIGAVVSRGGRPDLAGRSLAQVRAPTLLIVGGDDEAVIPLNEKAYQELQCQKRFEIVPRATHLFEEPGTLAIVAELAGRWFGEYLPSQGWHP
jgi:pimeloyl-ACP methyl ester carboxylesterase